MGIPGVDFRRYALYSCVAAALLAGFSRSEPSSGAALPTLPMANHSWPVPDTKQFGAGLEAAAYVEVPGSTKDYTYCNGGPYNPSCPMEKAGKRKFTFDAMAQLEEPPSVGGSATMAVTLDSNLGAATYSSSGTVTEANQELKDSTAGSQDQLGWDDTLSISSKTLKNGTPVTIGVRLVVSPTTTNVACDSQQNSYGALSFYMPNASSPSGPFQINGECDNGTFVYVIGNGKQKGTTIDGTISTAVGDSESIAALVEVTTQACNPANACVGTYTAALAGSYRFRITSITSGATYTTASGKTYE
jgi:hypothetical protein